MGPLPDEGMPTPRAIAMLRGLPSLADNARERPLPLALAAMFGRQGGCPTRSPDPLDGA